MKHFPLRLFFIPFLIFCFSSIASAASNDSAYNHEIRTTPLLSADTTASGQPIKYPKTAHPLVTMLLVEIPPRKQTGWHIHRRPMVAYILSGTLTVQFQGGKSATYKAGQAMAEVLNTPHNGINNGRETVKILVTVIGEKGIPVADKLNK
jgi:quercetin dioxygenase-like cupin family protein